MVQTALCEQIWVWNPKTTTGSYHSDPSKPGDNKQCVMVKIG